MDKCRSRQSSGMSEKSLCSPYCGVQQDGAKIQYTEIQTQTTCGKKKGRTIPDEMLSPSGTLYIIRMCALLFIWKQETLATVLSNYAPHHSHSICIAFNHSTNKLWNLVIYNIWKEKMNERDYGALRLLDLFQFIYLWDGGAKYCLTFTLIYCDNPW